MSTRVFPHPVTVAVLARAIDAMGRRGDTDARVVDRYRRRLTVERAMCGMM